MLSSQLSIIKPLVNTEQYRQIENYFNSLTPTSIITVSSFMAENKLNNQTAQNILKELVKDHLLKFCFGIRCPECGLLLISKEDISSIEKTIYCYHCEDTFDISPEDVDVVYAFENYPFVSGQQTNPIFEPERSAVPQRDTLAGLLASGTLDMCSRFYSPTDSEYQELEHLYGQIFTLQSDATATGNTLEDLTICLFNLCKHFRAMPIRLKPNQIDCYVRNTLFIPGISQAGCIDSFEIECKNEKDTPKAGYMNKLHSIMRLSGKSFGVIVSKCSAPKTFVSLSNQIYLADKMIIISLDKNDLEKIILQRANLLECISRKIDEVKLNATKDLVEIGLFDT